MEIQQLGNVSYCISFI